MSNMQCAHYLKINAGTPAATHARCDLNIGHKGNHVSGDRVWPGRHTGCVLHFVHDPKCVDCGPYMASARKAITPPEKLVASTPIASFAAPSKGNPKDAIGVSKAPLSTLSRRVMHEAGLAMLEGECKYWRHNYRAAPVRAMVYVDAADRHMSAWIEGQEIDPDTCAIDEATGLPDLATGLSHVVKAIACLMIIRDAQLYGSLIDDRPPAQSNPNWVAELNAKAKAIIGRCAGFERGAYTEANRSEHAAMSEALSSGPIKIDAARAAPVQDLAQPPKMCGEDCVCRTP